MSQEQETEEEGKDPELQTLTRATTRLPVEEDEYEGEVSPIALKSQSPLSSPINNTYHHHLSNFSQDEQGRTSFSKGVNPAEKTKIMKRRHTLKVTSVKACASKSACRKPKSSANNF